MRKSAAARLKQQREASTSAPKVTFLSKVAHKRKGVGKDDHPAKMVMSTSTRVNQEASRRNLLHLHVMTLARVSCRPMVPFKD